MVGGTGIAAIAVRTIAGPTNITGTGTHDIYVGSLATPTTDAGGNLDGIAAALTIAGGIRPGLDLLIVDASGDRASTTGTLTVNTFAGMGMTGVITYSNIQDLQINLGVSTENLLIENTDSGSTMINGGHGTDQVNIETTSGLVVINAGSGQNTIDVGTQYGGNDFGVAINHFSAPGGGVLNEIDGLIQVNGGTGNSTLNIDNSGATDSTTSVLTGSTVSGLDMHPAIVETVTINSATGGSFTLQVGTGGPVTSALPFNIDAAGLRAALLALNFPNVTGVSVNQSGNTYAISFSGGASIESENLTLIANGTNLVPPQTIIVQASSLDVVQTVTVAPTAAGIFNLTVGGPSGLTFTMTPGESANALYSRLTAAIKVLFPGLAIDTVDRDVLVSLFGNTYYVRYDGLLGGVIGTELLLSASPAQSVTQQSATAVELGLNADSGTYTISAGTGLVTYSLAWNASALQIQAALNGLLNSSQITVTANAGGFAIANLPYGIAAKITVDASMLVAPITTAVLAQGIAYNSVTTLNLDLAPHDNVVNVQGTTAVTNVFGHGGNEQFFVSSLANENLQTAPSADFLLGNLAGISGNLNLAAGSGDHTLLISNEGSVSGIPNGVITSVPTSLTALAGTQIEVDGFATAPIDYQAAGGIYAGGITYWTGYGSVNVTVNGIFQRAGVHNANGQSLRTITTLNTGLGTHNITVNLVGTASQGGLFVLNTQGPFTNYPTLTNSSTVNASASTLPLIIFGGQGTSTIAGGTGNDIIFGHSGQVVYDNARTSPAPFSAMVVPVISTMALTFHRRSCTRSARRLPVRSPSVLAPAR